MLIYYVMNQSVVPNRERVEDERVFSLFLFCWGDMRGIHKSQFIYSSVEKIRCRFSRLGSRDRWEL